MLNTDIITSHPAIKDAYEAYTQAEKEQASLGLIASRRHAEWMQEAARLAPGVALPVEPSSTPTDHEKRHAAMRLATAKKAMQAALRAHSDELAELFRTREQQSLAEVRELAARIDEITDSITDLLRDVIWFERESGLPIAIEQGLITDMKGVVVEIARGGSVGRNHPAGTFLANL